MVARYQWLAAELRQRITRGDWLLGAAIPSGRELREEYGVGRGVVEYAVAELRREGLIEGRRGARPVVAQLGLPEQRMVDPREDWPYTVLELASGTRLATPDLAGRLHLRERSRLTWTQRECLAPDGWAAMLITTYWRGAARPYEDTALVVAAGEFTADEGQAIGLTSGTPALRMERTRYTAAGQPVETADLVLRADRWRIAL